MLKKGVEITSKNSSVNLTHLTVLPLKVDYDALLWIVSASCGLVKEFPLLRPDK